jgi:hypothetical protein
MRESDIPACGDSSAALAVGINGDLRRGWYNGEAQQQQRQGNSPASARAAQTQGSFHPGSSNGWLSRYPPTCLRLHAVKFHPPDFVRHVVLHVVPPFALHFVLPADTIHSGSFGLTAVIIAVPLTFWIVFFFHDHSSQ